MPRLRHPRVVFLFKCLLYLAAATALTALFLTGVGFLGLVAVAGAAATLLDVAVGGALLPVLLLGTAAFAALGVGVVTGVRRVDRYVVAYDSEPDPLEAIKRRYVESDIDELELERRLDALLADREEPRASGLARSSERGRGGRPAARSRKRRCTAGETTSIPVRE